MVIKYERSDSFDLIFNILILIYMYDFIIQYIFSIINFLN